MCLHNHALLPTGGMIHKMCTWHFSPPTPCDRIHVLMKEGLIKKGERPEKQDEQGVIRKRVLLALASNPLVMGPTLLGFTSMVASWAFNLKPTALFLFGGIAGILIGGGSFISKLLLSGKSTAQRVMEDLDREHHELRKHELDDLEQILIQSDKDPRPEEALRDLRALVRTFEGLEKENSSAQWSVMMDVRLQVESLFTHCVQLIEKTHQLWLTSQQFSTQAAKQPVMDQREEIIGEVQCCVRQLSHSLVALQKMGHVKTSTEELHQMRQELDTSLQVARKVEDRMQNWSKAAAHQKSKKIR
jgi:hypothetical protein